MLFSFNNIHYNTYMLKFIWILKSWFISIYPSRHCLNGVPTWMCYGNKHITFTLPVHCTLALPSPLHVNQVDINVNSQKNVKESARIAVVVIFCGTPKNKL